MQKDFWRNIRVGIVGGGTWGTVLASMIAKNCREVRIWMRDEELTRSINATRFNQKYLPGLRLSEKIYAFSSLDRFFEGGIQLLLWALPSHGCREQARYVASSMSGDELVLHVTKGIEQGTMKRISEILVEEMPCRRIGVLSGPNLADEIARNEPTATVVASPFGEVCDAGQALLKNDRFRVYRASDVVGIEWAGALKNILAIAAGALDSMHLGWNARAMLITRGLAEMVRFSSFMGAQESTFLGLAGVGDLLATCCSPLSRNFRVGQRLAQGESLQQILLDLGSVAEGVGTTESVWEFASKHKISMPITEGVSHLLKSEMPLQEIVHQLMTRPMER